MARKTTDSFKDMTLRQIGAYATTNPLEGLRMAGECKQTATECIKAYRKAQTDKILDSVFPELKEFLKDN